MNMLANRLATAAALGAALLLSSALPAQENAADAQALFVDTYKCNLCHSVQAAEVAVKSEKTFAGDLGGFTTDDVDALGRYLRKEEPRAGEEHKKTYGGSEEDLQVILDWLATYEPAPDS
jgi:hypothetical protein